MEKTILILFCTICLYISGFSQLSVFNDGRVDMHSSTPAGGRAVRSTVYDPLACSWHLTYNSNDKFYVCAQGWLKCGGIYTNSDKKKKKDIRDLDSSLEKVIKLKGVSYKFKNDSVVDKNGGIKYFNTNDNDRTHLGFIAQDLENVLPDVVKEMNDGSKAIAYDEITALLVEALKEQQTIINDLTSRIAKLENKTPKEKSASIESLFSKDLNGASLSQNFPNPFDQLTTIKYFIPESIIQSKILIYDIHGTKVGSYIISNRGFGSIQIDANTLKAGVYLYTLIADNIVIDTKRMLLTE